MFTDLKSHWRFPPGLTDRNGGSDDTLRFDAPTKMTNPIDTTNALEEFTSVYRMFQRALIAFFRRRGVDADEARDLAQETFMRAYRAWNDFRGESTRKTWLLTIALNVWRNKLRWDATLKRGVETVALDPDTTSNGPGHSAERAGDLPDAHVLAREQRELVQSALAELPPQMQRCVVLYLEHRKYREIAEEMGISIGAVKSQIFDGRKRLRERLDQQTSSRGVR